MVGCFLMLKEWEINRAKVYHLDVDLVHSWVDWTLPVSKTEVGFGQSAALERCVCSGDLTRRCLFHAIVNQLEILRLSHGNNLFGHFRFRRSTVVHVVGQHRVRRESDR